MREMYVLLLLLVSSASCICQEKMKLNIDGTATETIPKTTSGKAMSGDYTHTHLIWRVDLYPSASTLSGSTMLEIRIVNVSAVPRALPLSQDGVKLVAECPDHTVLEEGSFLGSRADKKYFRQIGVFYGCTAFPSTLVQLSPGEWVTYVTKVPTDQLPKEIRAQIHFVRTKYLPATSGQTAEDLDWDVFEMSPWVQIPQTLGANK